MAHRKPRSDSKLLTLPQEDRDQIYTWLTTPGFGYAKTLSMVEVELGIDTSNGALNNFYKREFDERQSLRFMKAATASQSIEAEAEKDFSPAMAKLFGQLAFEAGVEDRPDQAEKFLKMALAVKADMMGEERFALEMRKFSESMKTRQETALDAIFEDIQGNAEAEALFNKMRDALGAATDG